MVDWYRVRDVEPLIAAPDRLFRVPTHIPTDAENLVMVRDLELGKDALDVALTARPDEEWLQVYERPVPVEVLTAVIDGEVAFASLPGTAVGRGAVTDAPDGTRWVGLSALHVTAAQRRRGHARALCSALLAWGASHGATRCYAQVLTENSAARTLYESMGFSVHHRSRYVRADAVQNGGGS
jgi:GNAT superfamily N-acetyltransferase